MSYVSCRVLMLTSTLEIAVNYSVYPSKARLHAFRRHGDTIQALVTRQSVNVPSASNPRCEFPGTRSLELDRGIFEEGLQTEVHLPAFGSLFNNSYSASYRGVQSESDTARRRQYRRSIMLGLVCRGAFENETFPSCCRKCHKGVGRAKAGTASGGGVPGGPNRRDDRVVLL